MQRIVFVGAPGSGKSTLATAVYTALKQRGDNAEMVYEWVRYDLQRHGPMRSIWEQYRTRQHQQEIEDAVPDGVAYTIVDSGTLSPYFYAVLYADYADARQRVVLQDMFRYLLDDLYQRRYDLICFLPRIAGALLDDGTRYQSPAEIDTLSTHMDLSFTQLFNMGNVCRVAGPAQERLGKVLAAIDARKELTRTFVA